MREELVSIKANGEKMKRKTNISACNKPCQHIGYSIIMYVYLYHYEWHKK